MEYKKPDLTKKELTENSTFAFDKINYLMMIGGVVAIVLGFSIMVMETAPHGFGFLGLTLGPVITFLGFMFEIFAILYKKKK